MDSKIKTIFKSVDGYLNETGDKGLVHNKSFEKIVAYSKELNKDEKVLDMFASYTRGVALAIGEKEAVQRGEEIIGFVSSTIPRMLSACSAINLSMRRACEYENILVCAEKQSLAGKLRRACYKNHNSVLAEEYRTLGRRFMHDAQKKYNDMDIVDRTVFNEYLGCFSKNAGQKSPLFDGFQKPDEINVVIGDPSDAVAVMRTNIDSMNDDYTFGA